MAPAPQIDWHSRAQSVRPRLQAFVAGRYVDAASGETFDNVSPIDGRLIGKVASGGPADIDAAVASARAVFNKGSWSKMPPARRKRVLLKFADLIRSNADELGLLETLDMGKPINNSVNGDMRAAAILMPLPRRIAGGSLFGKTLETVLTERPCRVIIESMPDGRVSRPLR